MYLIELENAPSRSLKLNNHEPSLGWKCLQTTSTVTFDNVLLRHYQLYWTAFYMIVKLKTLRRFVCSSNTLVFAGLYWKTADVTLTQEYPKLLHTKDGKKILCLLFPRHTLDTRHSCKITKRPNISISQTVYSTFSSNHVLYPTSFIQLGHKLTIHGE